MKPQSYVCACDADGVLLSFDEGFATVAQHLYPQQNVAKLNASYDLAERYGLTSTQVREVFQEMEDHPEGWINLPVLPGAVEAFRKMQREGWKIHIVTGIPEQVMRHRVDNLEKHGIRPEGILCAQSGSHSKRPLILDLRPSKFIDDRVRLLNEVPEVPWRVWVDQRDDQQGHEPDAGLIRVQSIHEWVHSSHYHCPMKRYTQERLKHFHGQHVDALATSTSHLLKGRKP